MDTSQNTTGIRAMLDYLHTSLPPSLARCSLLLLIFLTLLIYENYLSARLSARGMSAAAGRWLLGWMVTSGTIGQSVTFAGYQFGPIRYVD